MERDVFMNVVVSGSTLQTTGLTSPWIVPNQNYVTLVLDDAHAGWAMAAAVAQAIAKELSIAADVDLLSFDRDFVAIARHSRLRLSVE